MPFVSQAQRGYMHIHHPEIADRWEEHTPKGKKLPKHKKKESAAFALGKQAAEVMWQPRQTPKIDSIYDKLVFGKDEMQPVGKADVPRMQRIADYMAAAQPAVRDAVILSGGTPPKELIKNMPRTQHLEGPLDRLEGMRDMAANYYASLPEMGLEQYPESYHPYAHAVVMQANSPGALVHELGHGIDMQTPSPFGTFGRDVRNRLKPELLQEYAAWRKGRKAYEQGAAADPELDPKEFADVLSSYHKRKYPAYGTYLGGATGALAGAAAPLLAMQYANLPPGLAIRLALLGSAVGGIAGVPLGALTGKGLASLMHGRDLRKSEARLQNLRLDPERLKEVHARLAEIRQEREQAAMEAKAKKKKPVRKAAAAASGLGGGLRTIGKPLQTPQKPLPTPKPTPLPGGGTGVGMLGQPPKPALRPGGSMDPGFYLPSTGQNTDPGFYLPSTGQNMDPGFYPPGGGIDPGINLPSTGRNMDPGINLPSTGRNMDPGINLPRGGMPSGIGGLIQRFSPQPQQPPAQLQPPGGAGNSWLDRIRDIARGQRPFAAPQPPSVQQRIQDALRGAQPPVMQQLPYRFGQPQGVMQQLPYRFGQPQGVMQQLGAKRGSAPEEPALAFRLGQAAKQATAEFGLLGGLLGSLQAPEDNKAEGYARGARRGFLTGTGSAIGAGLGGLGGLLLASRGAGTSPGKLVATMGAGAGLGGLGGGGLAYYLGGRNRPDPTWEGGEMTKDQRANLGLYGSLAPGLLAGGLGMSAGQLIGSAAGLSPMQQLLAGATGAGIAGLGTVIPTALALDRNLPPVNVPEKTSVAFELGKRANTGLSSQNSPRGMVDYARQQVPTGPAVYQNSAANPGKRPNVGRIGAVTAKPPTRALASVGGVSTGNQQPKQPSMNLGGSESIPLGKQACDEPPRRSKYDKYLKQLQARREIPEEKLAS